MICLFFFAGVQFFFFLFIELLGTLISLRILNSIFTQNKHQFGIVKDVNTINSMI